jgi:sulfur carrier protein ThiS
MTMTIKSFQDGDQKVEFGGTEGMTLGEVARQAGIRLEGTTFILNGVRLPAETAASTPMKDGDELRSQPKGDGGR